MTIPLSYFSIGSDMSSLANVETIVQTCPHVLPDYGGRPMATQGATLQRAANGYGRRNGALTGAWRFDVMNDYSEYRTLKAYLNRAASMYIVTQDEDGHWSPYLCSLDVPFMDSSANTKNEIPFDITVNQFGGVLQYDTYGANHTVTVDEHLILCYYHAAAFTLTLPAISTVPTYVPYRFVNGGAYDVTLDGNSSETIDGSATKTLSGTNLLTDGNMEASDTSAWTSAGGATLSKQTGTPHGGSRVLRVARNGSALSYATQDALIVGRYYTLYGYVRSDGNATPVIYINNQSQYTFSTSTSWQQFWIDVTAQDETVKLGLSASSDGWYVEFDDVFLVYNLPEPYGYQVSTQCTLISNGTEWRTIDEE